MVGFKRMSAISLFTALLMALLIGCGPGGGTPPEQTVGMDAAPDAGSGGGQVNESTGYKQGAKETAADADTAQTTSGSDTVGDSASMAANEAVESGAGSTANEKEATFEPVQAAELKAEMPDKRWKKGGVSSVKGIADFQSVSVGLYLDTTEKPEKAADVYAYVLEGGKKYAIGLVGSYGEDNVKIETRDMTGDGSMELVISGALGASYIETQIIGYDAGNKRWYNYLTTGLLENDPERQTPGLFKATTVGSIPGTTWLFRWKEDHFEQAEIQR